LIIDGNTNFTNNYASLRGGAINWNYHEPEFGSNIRFFNNAAGWYGDSISSYA